MRPYPLLCQGQQIWLSPERCIYWEEQQTLVLSDMHIGKSAHFRKAGIAIPQQVFQEDLHRFFQQVHLFSPKQVIVAGDFFHSVTNLEHEWFSNWRKVLGSTKILLVKGNHEILVNSAYEDLGIEVIEKEFYLGPFRFSHELLNEKTETHFSFVGHTHPGIKINGKGKQSFVFPCFYFTKEFCILPAFSKFTGKYLVTPQNGEAAYAILGKGKEQSIVEIAG
jgi:DNA ligase-associated metallophosphoesterase